MNYKTISISALLATAILAVGCSRQPTMPEAEFGEIVRNVMERQIHDHEAAIHPNPDAIETLDTAAREAGLAVRFEAPGQCRFEPAQRGVRGALGRLLAIVATAMASGTWDRLKACRAEGCQWAFYDSAKNRSRTWCSMAVCGNRTKVRSYRQRRSEDD